MPSIEKNASIKNQQQSLPREYFQEMPRPFLRDATNKPFVSRYDEHEEQLNIKRRRIEQQPSGLYNREGEISTLNSNNQYSGVRQRQTGTIYDVDTRPACLDERIVLLPHKEVVNSVKLQGPIQTTGRGNFKSEQAHRASREHFQVPLSSSCALKERRSPLHSVDTSSDRSRYSPKLLDARERVPPFHDFSNPSSQLLPRTNTVASDGRVFLDSHSFNHISQRVEEPGRFLRSSFNELVIDPRQRERHENNSDRGVGSQDDNNKYSIHRSDAQTRFHEKKQHHLGAGESLRLGSQQQPINHQGLHWLREQSSRGLSDNLNPFDRHPPPGSTVEVWYEFICLPQKVDSIDKIHFRNREKKQWERTITPHPETRPPIYNLSSTQTLENPKIFPQHYRNSREWERRIDSEVVVLD